MGDESEAPRPDTPTRTSATVPDAVSDTRSAPTVDAAVDAVGETVASPAARSPAPAPAVAFPTIRPDVYVVGAELGRGGMGRVVSAYDTRLDRPVAIKELLVRSEALELRFAREARITAKLQHPAIVPVHEAGQWPDGSRFYTMKLIEGQPLDQLISAARPLADRLALVPKIATVCEAIAYAHKQRVIHRDLKPSNILVGEFGETLVVDWGIAKELDSSAPDEVDEAAKTTRLGGDATAIGSVLGTPAYMPPEQALGELVDERADVYSLGAVLYSLLTRRLPYSAASSDGVLAEVVAGPPASIKSLEPDVPPELVAIVEKSMHRDRASRYANASELVTDLQRYLTGQLVGSHRYTFGQLARRWAKKHRGAIAVSIAAFAMLAVVGTFAIWRIIDARNAADASARIAARERDAAADNNAKLLIESARREFLDGQGDRAAAFLASSYAMTDDKGMQVQAGLIVDRAVRTGYWLRNHVESAAYYGLNEEHLIVATNTDVSLHDPVTGREVSGRSIKSSELLAVSPGGRFMVTREPGATAWQLWNLNVPTTIPALTNAQYFEIEVSRDGNRVVLAEDTRLAVWTRGEGLSQSDLALSLGCSGGWNSAGPWDMACDARCDVIAIAGRCAVVVQLTTGALDTLDVGRILTSAAVSEDGTRVLLTTDPGFRTTAVVGNPSSLTRLELAEKKPEFRVHHISRDARRIIASEGSQLSVIDRDGGRQTIEVGEVVLSAGASDASDVIAVTAACNFAAFYLTDPLRRLETFRGAGPVRVAPSGRSALVGDTIVFLRRFFSEEIPNPRAPVRVFTDDGVVWSDGASFSVKGQGLPEYVADISDDGTQILGCGEILCEETIVSERPAGREVGRTPGATWWLSRHMLVKDADEGNLVRPITGGPEIQVPVCASRSKSEWWMSEDGKRVMCRCRGEQCGDFDRMIAVDLSRPTEILSNVPALDPPACHSGSFPSFGPMRGDYPQLIGCDEKTVILDRDAKIRCVGQHAVMGDDGLCYAVQGNEKSGPYHYQAASSIAVRDPATPDAGPMRVFGQRIAYAEIRGSILYAYASPTATSPPGLELWDATRGLLLGRVDVPRLTRTGFAVSFDGRTVIANDLAGNRVWIPIPFEQRPRELVAPLLESRTPWKVFGSDLERKTDPRSQLGRAPE